MIRIPNDTDGALVTLVAGDSAVTSAATRAALLDDCYAQSDINTLAVSPPDYPSQLDGINENAPQRTETTGRFWIDLVDGAPPAAQSAAAAILAARAPA